LAGLVQALAELQAPQILQRVGLRYVNRLTDPLATEPGAWRGRLTDALLGLTADETFMSRVTATQQQVQVALEPGIGCVLRHGAFLDATTSAYSYLLDIDVYNARASAFELNDIVHVAKRLNRTAFAVFARLVTAEYLSTLGPTELFPDTSGATS
jgi:uncharacterized protein (TIGR04255 family)